MSQKNVTRRSFLRISGVTAGAAFLAACAPSGGAPAAPASGGASSEAPAAATTEVRFSSWDWFAYVPGSPWADYNQNEAFPQFQNEFPDITPVWEPYGDGWEAKALTQMAAGTAPEIMSTWPPIVNTWAEKQQLVDIQPMVDVDIPDADDIFLKPAWEQMWDPITQIRMGIGTDIDVTSVYFNKQAFEEAGVALPTADWSTDVYTDAATKLTVRDSSDNITRWGAQLRPDAVLGYFYYVEAFGGNVRDDETFTTCLLDSEEAQQALEWIRAGMWDINCFAQSNQIAGTGIPNTWTGVLPANVVAFAERSADQFFELAENMPEGSWDIAHVASGPNGPVCMGAPDLWVMYKGVVERNNQDAAWTFLKWMGTSDYYQDNIATKAGRIPTLLSATKKWPDTLRSLDARLTNISLEVILEQLESGEARGPQLFRYQSVADEILGPILDQVYGQGTAPVSAIADAAPQVTKAQEDAMARAGA
jgi:hypothetical protein